MASRITKLPPALKHMLTLRNPNSTPCPNIDVLQGVLARTRDVARQKGAEQGWLAVSTATMLTRNCPPAMAALYAFATRQEGPEAETAQKPIALERRVRIAALMRETTIKGCVFVGVPKVINCLAGLTGGLDDDVKAALEKTSYRDAEQTNIPPILERGIKLFRSVYDPHTEKLLAKLGTYHPDFPGFIIRSEYGPLLQAPPEMPKEYQISRALTSAMGVACLRAEGGVGPQLTSHIYGLVKAQGWEGETEEDKWLATEEGAEWVVGLTDELSDLIRYGEDRAASKL
ncbi:hypothetical protein DACRYDRAFT_24991 [Dacryopinax primogenitus]|uniref:Uncharacterized protein n=1 Tax=Dacryopinax primogenitus (strain DJM 731) TaxID=1858805 RepID=M5FQA8_DACPD|nr:uncharacterized protein DACRYDRAFT_24991 [Dacryopinax primogenitus]EJT97613.1 hypothetical protein DACRYDRAFT_24991 [Dacryopinax primogenitus]